MADLGWAGMAGTAGAGDAIAQLFKQRMEQAQLNQQNDQFNRQMDQQDALVRLRYAEQAAAARAKAQERADALEERKQEALNASAQRAFVMNPAGYDFTANGTPSDVTDRMQQLGFPIQKIARPVTQSVSFMPMGAALPQGGTQGPGMGGNAGLRDTGPSQAEPSRSSSTMNDPLAVTSLTRGRTQADVEKDIADKRLQDDLDRRSQADADRRQTDIERMQMQLELANLRNEIAEGRNDPSDPKYQDKLEQQFRQLLMRTTSNRSGAYGVEDSKVNQAVHLMGLLEQSKDAQGNYDIPAPLRTEVAMGLARLTSPGGVVGENLEAKINQATAAGDMAAAMTYITGKPMNATPQGIAKMYRDSIIRQGRIAQENRANYLEMMKQQAPTSLEIDRRKRLIDSLGQLTSIPDDSAPKGGPPQAPAGWKYVPKPGGGWTAVKQ